MAALFLNTLKQVSQCCLGHGRGRDAQLGHSGSHSAVPPSAESPGTGSTGGMPSGRAGHPLCGYHCVFLSTEALPRGRRTSRCHRRASHSAATPWTAWGCCGSGRRWTGTWPCWFSHSRAQGWSSPWHTCVGCGEAVSEPPWLQWNLSSGDGLMKAFALLWTSFSFAPLYPTTIFPVILGAGLSRGAPWVPPVPTPWWSKASGSGRNTPRRELPSSCWEQL